jgi:hypothetical protein
VKFHPLFTGSLLNGGLAIAEDSIENKIFKGGFQEFFIIENKPPYTYKRISTKEGFELNEAVQDIFVESPGNLLIIGINEIVRYNYIKNIWKYYGANNKKNELTNMTQIVKDNNNTIWITGEKLGFYDKQTDVFKELKIPQIEDKFVFIGKYDQNHLILGTPFQVYVFDVNEWHKSKKINIKAFNQNNGFLGAEPVQQGYFKDKNGLIWIPTGSDISIFDTKKIDLSSDSLSTYFTHFNREPVPFNFSKEVFESKGEVRIEFESVGENKAQESQYSYNIDGYTDGWTAWQTEPVVNLFKLASGNYAIQVRARTGNSDDSISKPASLHFHVFVLPWQSPYFPVYALLMLFAGGGMAGYVFNQKNRKEKKAKDVLAQKEVMIEKQELENKNQALQVQSLQVQTAQAQMNPHFTFNVLGALQGLIYGNDTKSANENLLKLSKLMRSYLDASISSELDPNDPEKGFISLDKEIELLQMYIDFEKLKYADSFNATISVANDIATDFYKIPPLLLQPFLENAILHGVLPRKDKFGIIEIKFDLDENENLICKIIDNGIGREAAKKLKEKLIVTHISRGN